MSEKKRRASEGERTGSLCVRERDSERNAWRARFNTRGRKTEHVKNKQNSNASVRTARNERKKENRRDEERGKRQRARETL